MRTGNVWGGRKALLILLTPQHAASRVKRFQKKRKKNPRDQRNEEEKKKNPKTSPDAHWIHFPGRETTTPWKTHSHRWPCPKNVPERLPEGPGTPRKRRTRETPREHRGAAGARRGRGQRSRGVGVTGGVPPSPRAAPGPPQPPRRRPCFIFRVGTEPAWERPRTGAPGGFRVHFGGSRRGGVSGGSPAVGVIVHFWITEIQLAGPVLAATAVHRLCRAVTVCSLGHH